MKSMKARLILLFSLVILFLTGLLGIINLSIVKNDFLDNAKTNLVTIAETESKLIASKVNEYETEMVSLSQNSTVYSSKIVMKNKTIYLNSQAEKLGYSRLAIADTSGLGTYLEGKTSKDGELVTENISQESFFQQALSGSTVISDVWTDTEGISYYTVAAPIYEDETIVGVIYGNKTIDELNELVRDISYGESGIGYVINSAGVILAHKDLNQVTEKFNLLRASSTDSTYKSYSEMITRIVSAKVSGRETYSFKGSSLIAAYTPVNGIDWYLLVEVSEDEVLVRVHAIERILVFLIAGALLIGSFITFIISSSITKPIVLVTKDVEIKSRLNFSSDSSITGLLAKNRKDEIGKMVTSLRQMQEAIRDFIQKIADTATQLAASSEQMTSMTDLSEKSLEEVAKAIEEIARGAGEQAKDTAETATDVNNLGALLMQDATLIEQLNQSILEITSQRKNGLHSVDKLVLASQKSENALVSVQSAIVSNNESTGKIEAASQMIQNISDQTNLLALNAAIEAARAGDAGRGFAVVAEEIRSLAEQSSKFANEISAVIDELKEKSHYAVTAMQEVQQLSTEQQLTVTETKDSFFEIAASIDTTNTVISHLNDSSKKMSGNKDRIINMIENLSSISEENAAATEEAAASMNEQNRTLSDISSAAEHLASISLGLKEQLEKFTIE